MAVHADIDRRIAANRFPGWALAGVLTALCWACLALPALLSGGLIVTTHGGDALHVIDILERLSLGQEPHRDFITPIGRFAFAPIALLISAGLPAGQAFLSAQAILGACFGAAALALALPRMSWPFAAGFATLIIVLTVALVHGEAHAALSISMHYNRWCWALGFTALMAAILAPKHARAWEGLLIGAAMTGLALIKLTYFAAFAPIVVLGLLLTGQRKSLLVALFTGLAVAAALSVIWGIDHWQYYLRDVAHVAQSELRTKPGASLVELLTAPQNLASTLLSLTAVILLRHYGLKTEGLLILLVFVAGTYVTYQNYANDPLHFAFIALVLAIWAGRAADAQRLALALLATVFAATIAPSYTNLASSPLRLVAADHEAHVPILIGSARHQDLRVSLEDANRGRQLHIVTEGHALFYGYERPEPLSFRGEALPTCTSVPNGSYFASIAADLEARGLAQGAPVFIADIINPLWLYGDHPPLLGAMPWYYGGLHGLASAEFVLFPVCPNSPGTRIAIIEELEGAALTEIVRTPLYWLYAR